MSDVTAISDALAPFIAQAVCGCQMAMFIQMGIKYNEQAQLKEVFLQYRGKLTT